MPLHLVTYGIDRTISSLNNIKYGLNEGGDSFVEEIVKEMENLFFMDSAKIESKAVSAVETLIWEYDKLMPQINKDDKQPLWDGYIYIYNDSNHCNENMKGRVPLQVKGKRKV